MNFRQAQSYCLTPPVFPFGDRPCSHCFDQSRPNYNGRCEDCWVETIEILLAGYSRERDWASLNGKGFAHGNPDFPDRRWKNYNRIKGE